MQNSLLNTVKKIQEQETKINVEELELLLDCNIEEVISMCKRACLKPKTDSAGNTYFTKEDVNILKKIKELYNQAQNIGAKEEVVSISSLENVNNSNNDLQDINKKINFLQKAKNRMKQESLTPINAASSISVLNNRMEKLESNIISKMTELLSEKMDGFDEIIVELIRAKTENENLRQQVNDLNKQLFMLKNELATYSPLALGIYIKKDNNEL